MNSSEQPATILPAVGILGGTFNPVHFGHLRMAEELAESLKLETVRFIPAAKPPHKHAPVISAEQRAAMVKLAIQDNPRFVFDDCELRRNGASYTLDTLSSLRAELGESTSLILFMGSDAFTQFDTWHCWRDIIKLCHIALVARPPQHGHPQPLSAALETFLQDHYSENADALHHAPFGVITMRTITALDISSTAIRHALQHGRSVHYLMPESVIDFIHVNHLYR